MYGGVYMVRNITLSNEVFLTLKAVKQGKESYSKVVARLLGTGKPETLLEKRIKLIEDFLDEKSNGEFTRYQDAQTD